jgi:hypothetical protein
MKNFTKIINPGKVQYSNGKFPTFCKIEYKDGKLSITGVEAPDIHGNCKGSCGQINPIKLDVFSDGWDEEVLTVFSIIWDKYHLNELHAECEHQAILGWTYDTHVGKNCPICGYIIGSEWKSIIVPEWAVEYLYNLPDTKITPTWV